MQVLTLSVLSRKLREFNCKTIFFIMSNSLTYNAFKIHYCLGHSLGAGTAILLGLLLRPMYPELRVYAFSTPGSFTVLISVLYELPISSV